MFLAPCKGIQDGLNFSIPRCGFWILGIGFRIPIVIGIPDSLKQSFPGFWNPDSLT